MCWQVDLTNVSQMMVCPEGFGQPAHVSEVATKLAYIKNLSSVYWALFMGLR